MKTTERFRSAFISATRSLTLLILCLQVGNNSFSQIDTGRGKVVLSDRVAGEVMKDIIKGDACREIADILKKQIDSYQEIIKTNQQMITGLQQREKNLEQMVNNQRIITSDWEAKYKEAEKLRKRSVRWGRFKVVVIGGLAGFLIYQSVK